MNDSSRRGLLGGVAASLLLGGCDRVAQNEDVKSLLGRTEGLTRWVQRLITPKAALAREYTEADLSPAFRGNGTGWATSVAKVGSIAGPYIAGLILATSLPVRNIYAILAICPAVFVVCILIIGIRHTKILKREAGAGTMPYAANALPLPSAGQGVAKAV